MKIKNYNKEIIKLFARSILEDEFNQRSQNNNIYQEDLSGADTLRRLLDINPRHSGCLEVLDVGGGGDYINRFLKYEHNLIPLEPCPQRNLGHSVPGWAENIETPKLFDILVCWGTLCFVRSLPETLISFNNVLKIGGLLVLDIVTNTIMPLAQTAHRDSFIRYMELYGFRLEEYKEFTTCTSHHRCGMRFYKYEHFDINRLRIPQAQNGQVLNYLEKRDFYLK